MKRREFLARTGAGILVAGARPARATPQAVDALAPLRDALHEPPDAAKPMTRWWWFGGAVTPDEITRQLTFMKEAGLRGAEIQPVYPVAVDDAERGIRHIPYYTDAWWDVLRHASVEAHRLGLQLDFTLGSGWPYGGPFITGGLAARRIRVLSEDVVAPRELDWDVTTILTGDDRPVRVVAAPVDASGRAVVEEARVLADQPEAFQVGPRDGRRIRFAPGEGAWRVFIFLDTLTGQLVKRPTLGMEGYVLDHMSREAMDLFLRAAGDRVLDALEGAPDPPFDSVFCDSLEVYGADWTPAMLEEFERRRGYDLAPFLPALFQDTGAATPHVRYDYHRTLSELNLEHFFEPLVEWAGARGMRARIQAHGAPGDVMHGYGIADVPEGENIFGGDRNVVNLRHRRLASSAAHLYGKPVASSETYTWLRTPLYMTTLEMMKAATDAVLLDGLNQIVNHGWSYSPQVAGEPGWAFYASTAINHTNTWWRHYHHVARYVQRACAQLRRGVSVNPVAVYLPVADLYARAGAGGMHVDVEAESMVDPALFTGLRRSGYDFDLVHDHALDALARVEEGEIRAGTGRYPVVIVPEVRWMPVASLARLADLANGGGRVIVVGTGPEGAPGLRERDSPEFGAALARLRGGRATFVDDAVAAVDLIGEWLAPDAAIASARDEEERALAAESVGFVHRREGEADVYFLANVSEHRFDLRVRFAAGHRAPERWGLEPASVHTTLVYAFGEDPATGAAVTEVGLHLEPFESCCVAFGADRTPPRVTGGDWPGPLWIEASGDGLTVTGRVRENRAHALRLADGRRETFRVTDLPDSLGVEGPWTLALGDGAPFEIPRLAPWAELEGGAGFSGWGRYETTFEVPDVAGILWILDLGLVHETAEVWLNGEPLGVAWRSPRQLDCGDLLRPGRNRLAVEVANLWIHAMLEREPPPEWDALETSWGIRWGRYGEVPPESVPPSGLLGPVRLLPSREHVLTV